MTVFATRPIDVIDLGSIAAAIEEIAQAVERRRVAEALSGSEEQVRQLQKMEAVGRLAGGIAHDFNNLLVVVMGYSQMLLESIDRGDPPCRESVQIIESTAVRAAKLTRQLLAFSRKQVLAPTLLDLNTVITGMKGLLRRLIGESVELAFTPAENLDLVRLDSGQLEQVVVNLVVNARDAMPNGGRISIDLKNVDLDEGEVARNPGCSQGSNVMIRITDTGIGMDAATQSKIFEPFFTTKEPGKGTGLGLATVHGIVAQSGGSISVESAPGRGSSFTLYFPRAVGEVEAPIEAESSSSRGSETVLLAEDEHEVRVLLEQVLKNHGYDVICVSRPSDALRIAEHHAGPIHLLLTDMVMPEMSGAVLAERLCATRPEMAVLQMSGYTEYRSGTSIEENQPAFLQKPFTPGSVARMVRSVLDAHVSRAVVPVA